jgi:hypothetical protein
MMVIYGGYVSEEHFDSIFREGKIILYEKTYLTALDCTVTKQMYMYRTK